MKLSRIDNHIKWLLSRRDILITKTCKGGKLREITGRKTYHLSHFDLRSRFDPPHVTTMDYGHNRSHEEKHLALLHTGLPNISSFNVPFWSGSMNQAHIPVVHTRNCVYQSLVLLYQIGTTMKIKLTDEWSNFIRIYRNWISSKFNELRPKSVPKLFAWPQSTVDKKSAEKNSFSVIVIGHHPNGNIARANCLFSRYARQVRQGPVR